MLYLLVSLFPCLPVCLLNLLESLSTRSFTIHGAQPEVRLHKFFALHMSHGRHVLSQRAPRYFFRPCRFATILRISEHFCNGNTVSCSDKGKEKSS